MTEIKNQPIQLFLDELASKSATPGGGSVAALMGAQGAALVSMVCNLTIGKPQFAEVETELREVLVKAENLRQALTGLIQSDIDVFDQLMTKYALPKETDTEKATRSQEIQAVLRDATEVPLQCARACADVVTLCKIAAEKGSPGVVSDAGAGVMAAYAGVKTAALNVYINTGSLKDLNFAQTKVAEIEAICENLETRVNEIYQLVKSRL
jgi:formiminotetrahydrofolate cyclodeaminase